MIRRTLIAFGLIACGFAVASAAETPGDLVSEIKAALDAHDKAAFEKCINLEGADEQTRRALSEIETTVFAFPTHYVSFVDQDDNGEPLARKDGKSYTLNGEWHSEVCLYLSKPPSKGFVLPAGLIRGKYLLLLPVELKH
jgi:hypothetical protein